MLSWALSSNFTVPAAGTTAVASFVDTANMVPGVLLSMEDTTKISLLGVVSTTSLTAVLANRNYSYSPPFAHTFLAGSFAYSEGVDYQNVFWDRFTAGSNDPPASLYATFDVINAASTLGFNDSATWGAVFKSVVPLYFSTGSSINVRIKWFSVAATTGAALFGAAFERMSQTANSDHFGTQVLALSTTNGVAGVITETFINIPYANMSSAVADDPYRLQIQRIGGDATDTLVGNAEVLFVTVESGA